MDEHLSLKCGTPTTDDLLLVACELGSSWKMLGRALDLPEHVLEQIEEDERKLFDKCYGVEEFSNIFLLMIDDFYYGIFSIKRRTPNKRRAQINAGSTGHSLK